VKRTAVVAQINAHYPEASVGSPAPSQGLPIIKGAKQAVEDNQGLALALVEVMKQRHGAKIAKASPAKRRGFGNAKCVGAINAFR
jgi:hypothetical protein